MEVVLALTQLRKLSSLQDCPYLFLCVCFIVVVVAAVVVTLEMMNRLDNSAKASHLLHTSKQKRRRSEKSVSDLESHHFSLNGNNRPKILSACALMH